MAVTKKCPHCGGTLALGYSRGSSAEVSKYVRRRKRPFSYAEVMEKFGMTKAASLWHLRRLVRAGEVRHLGYGEWARA